MLPHRVPSGSNSPLIGFEEGFPNGMFFDPAKIGPELFNINGLSLDCMFVLSNVGVARGMSENVVNSPLKIAKSSILGSCASCWEGSGAQVGSPAVAGWV